MKTRRGTLAVACLAASLLVGTPGPAALSARGEDAIGPVDRFRLDQTALTPGYQLRHCATPAVPPHLEIEVLDPGVEQLGRPAVRLQTNPDGSIAVDIPRVVLVHKYYYSGDRDFQAQIFQGGPATVVASHPRTGERCYIPVQMLPGAPRVYYDRWSIRYEFGESAITIHFGRFCGPKVSYRNGPVPGAAVKKTAGAVVAAGAGLAEHSGLANLSVGAAAGAKQTLVAAVGGTREMVKMAATPMIQAIGLVPFGQALISGVRDAGTSRALHYRDQGVTQVAAAKRRAEASISTLR